MHAIHETTNPVAAEKSSRAATCLASCRKLIAQIETTKTAILNEFHESLEANDHLLHLALNEAEALAWQSGVPQLIFPTLALEKAQALATWYARQQSMQRTNSRLGFAA